MNHMNVSIRNFCFHIFLLGAVLLGACTQDYEPMIEGIWDEINVEDIEASREQEWHFKGNVVKIFRYDKNDPDKKLYPVDNGRYLVRKTPQGAKLRLTEMGDNRFNNDWEIIRLRKDKMIISVEVPGEVIYKEFIKRTKKEEDS